MTSNSFSIRNELKSSQKTIWRNVQKFNKSKIFTYSFHKISGCFKIQMVSVALELQKSRCSSSQMLSKVRVVFSTHASIKVKSFLSFRKKRKKNLNWNKVINLQLKLDEYTGPSTTYLTCTATKIEIKQIFKAFNNLPKL